LLLAGQVGLSAFGLAPHLAAWWVSLSEPSADELGPLLAWADTQIEPGRGVLVVSARMPYVVSFARASYALYPRTVVPYLPPGDVDDQDWDMRAPLRAGAVGELAAKRGVNDVLVDGVPPSDVAVAAGTRRVEYPDGTNQYLLRLP